MNEKLAYKLTPAGHDSPEWKRKYDKPDSKLAKAFEKWLAEVPQIIVEQETTFTSDGREEVNGPNIEQVYVRAQELIKNVKTNAGDANALLFDYENHPRIENAGVFFSAIYNQCKDSEIVFDLDSKISWLGYKLPKEKTLIVDARTGNYAGFRANGTLIHRYKTDHDNHSYINYFGDHAHGPVINYGTLGGFFGAGATSLVIDMGKTWSWSGIETKACYLHFGWTGTGLCKRASRLVINDGETGFDGEIKGAESFRHATNIVLSLKPTEIGDLSRVKLFLDADKCAQIPELRQYVGELRAQFEPGRKDYKLALEALRKLGPEPDKKIEHDIETILRKGGHNV